MSAYTLVDHRSDVIVVGAGGAGLRATLGLADGFPREVPDPELIQRGDAVLDVKQIARWAGCIGNRSTVVPIVDAKHDVFLSLAEPRRAAFLELERWLDWYVEWSQSAGATAQSEQG